MRRNKNFYWYRKERISWSSSHRKKRRQKIINFFKRHNLSSQKNIDFSIGIVTSVGKDVDYEENDNGKEFYYIELDSYKWINLNEIEEIIEIE